MGNQMVESNQDIQIHHNRPKIAIVSFDSLGDSLLYLLLANNLSHNAYDVTYFVRVGYELRYWFKEFQVLQYPQLDDLDLVLSSFNFVIMCPSKLMRTKFAEQPAYLEHIKSRYFLVCQDTDDCWRYDHNLRIYRTTEPGIYESLKPIINATGSLRYKSFKDESTVDMLCGYMQEVMQLSNVSRHIDLQPPVNLIFRKYKKRIIISPDSAGPEEKNWGKNQFIKLCGKLKLYGFEPVIVVAPQNHEAWLKLANNQFSVPVFRDLGNLASYIYESYALIANDSGNGHLASFLGIPVLTIYKKANPKFYWRPDWNKNTMVVFPSFVIKLSSLRIWRPFVTVRAVLKATFKLIEQT